MAYTLSPKDGMSNISGKHLVQKGKKKKKVAKVPTYTRIDKDSVFQFCLFPLIMRQKRGRLWKVPLKDYSMLSFISHQYCTTKSKKVVYATKLRTMIHSFKFEEILFFFPISLILSKLFFPHYQEESVRKMWWQPLRSFKNFTLDCTRFFFFW